MKKCAVIGLGRFGTSVARALVAEGAEVVAIDSAMEKVEGIKDEVAYAIRLDASDEKAVKNIGLGGMDIVVVAIENDFEACQLAVIYAKQAGVPLIVARASSELHAKILKLIGADQIVNPELDYGRRLGSRLGKTHVMDYFELDEGYSFIELVAPDNFVGKSIVELDLRKRYGANLVAFKRLREIKTGEKKEVLMITSPEEKLLKDDVLLLVGRKEDLEKMSNL